ncbi:MAG: tetratricopeptide repeat protein [Candidatus Xenobia bacterium]
MPDANFERMLAQARALVGQGKFDEALGYYREALQLDPYHTECYREMGAVYEKRGDLIKAIDSWLMCAQFLLGQGLFDDALKVYTQIVTIEANLGKTKMIIGNPDQVRAHLVSKRGELAANMGNIYLQRGDTDKAISILKGALDTAASHSGVHTMLGIAYMQKSLDREAFGEFQEVVRLTPNEAAFAYEKIGEIFIRQGRPPQGTIVWFRNAGEEYHRHEQLNDAVRCYETILGFEPRNKDVLLKLGEIYTQLGMKDRAFNIYKQLAQVFLEDGMPDKVIGLYEKLVDLNPDDQQAVGDLIEVYRNILERDASNLGVLTKLVKQLLRRGHIGEALPEYLRLAKSYLEKTLFDDALQAAQRILELDPRNVEARKILAEVYLRKGDRDTSKAEFRIVLKLLKDAGAEAEAMQLNDHVKRLFPEDPEFNLQMIQDLLDQGQFETALGHLDQLLSSRPDDVRALFLKADTLAGLSRWDEAILAFNLVLARDPSRYDIRRRLADYFFSVGRLEDATEEIRHLVGTLREQGRYLEAEMLIRKLLAYYPDSVQIRAQIAELKGMQQEKEKAVRECLLLANLFIQQQILDRAMETLQHILDYEPDNLNARQRMAQVARKAGITAVALTQYVHLANYYSTRNLPKQAHKALEEILEIDPENIEHRLMLIEMLVKQVRIEEAIEQYKVVLRYHLGQHKAAEAARCVQDILALQPLNSELRMELAEVYLTHNLTAEGLVLLEDLVKVHTNKKQFGRLAAVYKRLSEVMSQQKQWEPYWDYIEKMAELDAQEGHPEKAVIGYQEALEGVLRLKLQEKAAGICARLSELYVQQHQIADGVSALQRIADRLHGEIDPAASDWLQGRVVELLEKSDSWESAFRMLADAAEKAEQEGQFEEALSTRSRGLALLIKQGTPALLVAETFKMVELALRLDDLARAREIVTEVSPHAGEDLRARFADKLFEHRRYDPARELYEQLREGGVETPMGLARLGLILALSGDMQGFAPFAPSIFSKGLLGNTIEEYKRAIEYHPGEGGSHLRLGRFYEAMGFDEEAIAEYQKATRDRTTGCEAYQLIGKSFIRQGMADLAVRTFLRIIDRFPEDETLPTRYELAELYEQSGKLEEALATYSDVYGIDIGYRDVSARMDQIQALLAQRASGAAGSVIPFERPGDTAENPG